MILLVEDTPSMRKIVAAMLRKLGHVDILETADGQAALEQLRMRHIELVLTDWMMPGMTGGQLVETIRATPACADVPVVVFTATDDEGARTAALAAGADSFLRKPFSPSQLRQAMLEARVARGTAEIRRVILGADRLRGEDTHALVVVGQRAVTAQQLTRSEQAGSLRFLSAILGAVELLNGKGETPVAGYSLEGDGTDLSRSVRGLAHRVRLALVSTSLPTAVTTARLLSINRPAGLEIFLVHRQAGEIGGRVRRTLDTMGIKLLEERRQDAESLAKLLREQGFESAPEAGELPTPEELQQRLEEDVRSTVDLPVLAHVFHKITELDQDAESAMQDWIDVVRTDPLSSAQIIRRARSAAYSFQGDVKQIDEAIILLGKNAVKEIVVSGAVKQALDQVTEKGFSVEDYWVHSVAVAVAGRILSFPLDESTWGPDDAKAFEDLGLEPAQTAALKEAGLCNRFDLKPGEDAFVGGIMHDIGKVVLAHAYPGIFPAVLETLQDRKWAVPMATVEDELTGGSDHAVVGGVLAGEWDLGALPTAGVLQHHAHHPTSSLARLLAVADFVAATLFPFPAEAKYPHLQVVAQMQAAEGKEAADKVTVPEGLSVFLTDAITDELKTSRSQLLHLAHVLAPAIRRHVQDIRNSV